MKILGVDSSGLVASAAILAGDAIMAEFTVNNKQTHSQTLLPMIKEVVDYAGIALEELDAIAVAAGPGSFTGLRIGSATVKGLGLVLDKPVIPVPTLEGLAYQLAEADGFICPVMDARRNQVYTGIYEFLRKEGMPVSYKLVSLLPQCAVSIDEIAEKCNSFEREVIFLGDGVPVYEKKLADLMKVPYGFAPAHMNRQRAAAFGILASDYYKEGKVVSAADHAPEYLRLSQAEREKQEKS